MINCICCASLTVLERGYRDICPVCYWPDDGYYENPDEAEGGTTGGLSLTQARANYAALGAIEERLTGSVRPAASQELPSVSASELIWHINHFLGSDWSADPAAAASRQAFHEIRKSGFLRNDIYLRDIAYRFSRTAHLKENADPEERHSAYLTLRDELERYRNGCRGTLSNVEARQVYLSQLAQTLLLDISYLLLVRDPIGIVFGPEYPQPQLDEYDQEAAALSANLRNLHNPEQVAECLNTILKDQFERVNFQKLSGSDELPMRIMELKLRDYRDLFGT